MKHPAYQRTLDKLYRTAISRERAEARLENLEQRMRFNNPRARDARRYLKAVIAAYETYIKRLKVEELISAD